jgi:transposase
LTIEVDSEEGCTFVVMEDKKAINVYEYLTSFFLPEGMLDFFEVVWADEMSLSSREQKQAIVYKRVLKVHLDERDNRTEEQQALRPNGFTEPTIVADFPSRDRRMELHIRRRRWLTPEGKSVILNIYPLVAAGTRYSVEFAEFLKKKTWMQSR